MKFNTLKKLLVFTICVPMILTGCNKAQDVKPAETKEETVSKEETKDADKEFKIGIAQLVEHPALDASRKGFIDELKNLGVNVVVDEKNAQGDVANAQMIAEKFVKDDVDMIFSIATLTSQAAKKAIEGTDIVAGGDELMYFGIETKGVEGDFSSKSWTLKAVNM